MKSQQPYHWEFNPTLDELTAVVIKYRQHKLAVTQDEVEIGWLLKEAASLNNKYLKGENIDNNNFIRIDQRIESLSIYKINHKAKMEDLCTLINILMAKLNTFFNDICDDVANETISKYKFLEYLEVYSNLIKGLMDLPDLHQFSTQILDMVNKHIIPKVEINNK